MTTEISPPQKEESERLVTSGRVELPTNQGALTTALTQIDASAEQVLDEIRADRA